MRTSILTRMLFQLLLRSTVSLSTAFINTGVELAAGELTKSLSPFQLGVTLSSSIHSKGDPISRSKWPTFSTVILSSETSSGA